MQGKDDEEQPLMLVALQKVPHLAHVCANLRVLKELRSISSETRSVSSGLITGLTMDFVDAISDSERRSLTSVLSTSGLRRICVVLHLERHGLIEADLLSLITCIQKPLSSVTQLSIHLRGVDTGEIQNPLIFAAAATVRILGPFCGPLTHITVSGKVRAWGENTYTPLLNAASMVCAKSLTHFSFTMEVRRPMQQLQDGQDDEILENGCEFILDITACAALSLFTRLTHLRLEHGSICDESVWSTLPRSLQFLDFCAAGVNLPDTHSFPSLHTLIMKQCDCHNLIQLLKASPKLNQLSLLKLYTPTCQEEQGALDEVMRHPVWSSNNDGGTHSTPVTTLQQRGAWGDQSHLSPWAILASLPVMPTISNFRFDFTDGQAGPYLFTNPVRLLHHIPRLFPNLEELCLEHVPPLDSDLLELHSCICLQKLDLRMSGDVTGEALLNLVIALPSLLWVEVTRCKSLSEFHTKAISALLVKREGVRS